MINQGEMLTLSDNKKAFVYGLKKYYSQEFTGRGYVDITYRNGVTKRIYAIANDTTRSIKQVAEKAIADNS